MKFLSQILAIHPRGRQYERPKTPKKGFSHAKGKTFKEELDWLSSSVDDLIEEWEFGDRINKLLYEVQSIHNFVTDGMNEDKKLATYDKLAKMASTLGKEIQKLYSKGKLPEHVSRDMVHSLLDVVKSVEDKREELQQFIAEMAKVRTKLKGLGF